MTINNELLTMIIAEMRKKVEAGPVNPKDLEFIEMIEKLVVEPDAEVALRLLKERTQDKQ